VVSRAVRVAGTSAAQALTGLAAQLEQSDHAAVTWLRDAIAWWPHPGIEGSWLTRTMRRGLAELCRQTASRGDLLPPGLGIADLAALRELRRAGAVQRQLVEMGRTHNVWTHAPFLDNSVIRACLRTTAFRRADPVAPKPLLGMAMTGLVPEPVLNRVGKGDYIGEDYAGLRANTKSLCKLVMDSRVAELGMVDPVAVVRSIRAVDVCRLPFAALNRLLGVELWLRADELGRTC
jgi:asparagine synthase (glutamine-hydrolysing)